MWWDFFICYFLVTLCSIIIILFFEWSDDNDITLWSITSAVIYGVIPLVNIFVIIVAIMALFSELIGAIHKFCYKISFNTIEKMKRTIVISGTSHNGGENGRN